ncbi:MAG: AbgT family transporter [Firmicutes bacterium]|nr:AbgT family transporter [Bacillota bacterium]
MQDVQGIRIGKRTFITSALIILSLMIISGIMTRLIPSGSYERFHINGMVTINPDSFQYVDKVIFPVYRWFTAPFEVLFSENAPVIIVLILLITFIGGGYEILNRIGVFREIITKIVNRYGSKRYLLIAAVSIVFMFFGSFLGMFEEIVALIPIVVILSYTMGWDALLGLGLSLLSTCFGFAVAVSNPYTVGIAQKLAGLPVFSGISFRIIVFIVLYTILYIFLVTYAKKLDRNQALSSVFEEDRENRELYNINKNSGSLNVGGDSLTPLETAGIKKATTWFLGCVGAILIVIAMSTIVEGFSDFSMPAIALIYLAAGIGAGFRGGLTGREVLSSFGKGIAGIAPGIILILMAMSVNYIITRGGVMDTIIYRASGLISDEAPIVSSYIIYGLVLAVNFFIGSASAKAMLLIPIITPLADLIGLTRQTMVLAFCFGDGFSNVLYPTNPVLLIALGLTTVSYIKWFKWIIFLQLFVLLITAVFLAIAVMIGFGPF